jgi:fatty-acyl-CoA synthase
MCRNHRGFIDATVAVLRSSAPTRCTSTPPFAGPQITEVVKREKPGRAHLRREFEGSRTTPGERRKRFIAWNDGDDKPKDPLLEDLIEAGDTDDVVPARREGPRRHPHQRHDRHAEGAQRKQPESLDPAAALFSKIPLHAGSAR